MNRLLTGVLASAQRARHMYQPRISIIAAPSPNLLHLNHPHLKSTQLISRHYHKIESSRKPDRNIDAPSWLLKYCKKIDRPRPRKGAGNGPSTRVARLESMEKLLHTIQLEEIELTSAKDMKLAIEQYDYLASYNWLDGKESTILVPGSPPRWTPPYRAAKLKEDSGKHYRDPNSARYPAHPVEPAIRALLETRPDFDSLAVDVVGCGNTMGSLLSACRLNDAKTFTLGVERVGNTIFLIRQTPPNEVIEDIRGFGHSFPDAYTTWPPDVKGSASHQRLVQYNFAGLQCIVRSKSDGYLPDKVPRANDFSNPQMNETIIEEDNHLLTVSRSIKTTGSKLFLQSAGRMIPQEAIFDLKTRAVGRPFELEEVLPRLWVTQTPNFIIARHDYGIFKDKDLQIGNVKPFIQLWQSKNREVLLRLQSVLRKLIEITRQEGSSRVQVRRAETGPLLVVQTIEEWSVLPTDLKARWEGRELNTE